MLYSDIPFRRVLVTHARDAVQSALPAWLEVFTAGDRKSRGALTATLRAYADADMNALRAAKELGIHPNRDAARLRMRRRNKWIRGKVRPWTIQTSSCCSASSF
jgi:sugar diacid utilization regulator